MDCQCVDRKTCSVSSLRKSSSVLLQKTDQWDEGFSGHQSLPDVSVDTNYSVPPSKERKESRTIYSLLPSLPAIIEDSSPGSPPLPSPPRIDYQCERIVRYSPYPSPLPSPIRSNPVNDSYLTSGQFNTGVIYHNLLQFRVSSVESDEGDSVQLSEPHSDPPSPECECVDRGHPLSPTVECTEGIEQSSESSVSKTQYICEDCLAGSHQEAKITVPVLRNSTDSTYSFEVDSLLNELCNASVIGITKRRHRNMARPDNPQDPWHVHENSNKDEATIPLKENYGQQHSASPSETFFAVEPISTKDWPQKKKDCCQRKSILEKWLIVLCLLLSAGCIAFAFRMLWEHMQNVQIIGRAPETSESPFSGVVDPSHKVCMSEKCVKTAASLLSSMDASADPCTDFYQFACGSWNKKHIIPEDRSSISTFEVLAEEVQVILKGLLEEQIFSNDSQAIRKAKTFFGSCMNTSQLKLIGDAPLLATIESLGGWPVLNSNWTKPAMSVEELLGRLKIDTHLGVMLDLWVGPDDKNSALNVIQLDQTQLGMPSRDYYLKTNSVKDLRAYHRYMTEVAVLLGAEKKIAAEEMKKVINFEVQLANITVPDVDRLDAGAIYKGISLSRLEQEIPDFKWRQYLESLIIPVMDDERIVIYSNSYLKEMTKILLETEPRIVWNYVIWRLIMDLIPYLHEGFLEKRKEFRKVLYGIEADQSRWNQCVEWTNKKLGSAMGAMFIRQHFNEESKSTAMEMIHDIRMAFSEVLNGLSWMDEETKIVARDKVEAMNERIGFPDFITNPKRLDNEYAKLNISEGTFLENILALKEFEVMQYLETLRKPVDRNKWPTEPAVVNAFYNPNKNDIVFPAGILQPFFYSKDFPKSLNYGGIGVVIGHEMTHGFDDRGRQFDKDGNLKQWWNNKTIEEFRKRAQCIIDQYSDYTIKEIGVNLDGRLTQGENIADNGGLKLAFKAYKKWIARNGIEELLPGITLNHDQLFFLNYAQIWCGTMRPEDAVSKSRTSVHSPGYVRVVGPLSNSAEYAEVFNCKAGTPMNPVKKCSVF